MKASEHASAASPRQATIMTRRCWESVFICEARLPNGSRVSLRRPARPGAPMIELLTDEDWRTNAILPRRDRAANFTRLLGRCLL